MATYKIWFVDENEIQRITFRKIFKDKFDIFIVEAEKYDTPRELLEDSLKSWVDILLIDYYMTEQLWYNADQLEEEFKKINPHFPFLIVTSEIDDAFLHIDNPSIVYSKSIWKDNNQELADFKTKLEKIIEKYQNKLHEYEIELEELEKKSTNELLTPEEEDRFVKINKFLLETKWDFTSGSFFSNDTNKKLDSIIEKTEELLDKLWENE